MKERTRSFAWSETPLGSIADWPQSLRTAVDIMLDSAYASFVCWGPDCVHLYNDAAISLKRAKHPEAFGEPLRKAWADVWEGVGNLIAQVINTGKAVVGEDLPVVLERGQRVEAAWFTFSYTPLRDESGRVAGIFISAIETTQRRINEERFRQFAEASSDVLWIRDAATLEMEYVSPAFDKVYGASRSVVMSPGDPRRWAALIIPDDRNAALTRIEEVRRGAAVVHEFRIMRSSDGEFRWIRDADFPLFDERGQIQRIAGVATDVTETKQAVQQQRVLLAELQHRVRNIMAMIRSITHRTGATAESVEAYAALMAGRLTALGRTQALLTRAANIGVDLATLIREEIAAQADHEGQYKISGPELLVSPKVAEVLTLAFHELTTNALKYGALAVQKGLVSATWRVRYEADEPWLCFEWDERGHPIAVSASRRKGFGTELIERQVPYELRGLGVLEFRADGAYCRLEFPLARGDSVLETDAVTLKSSISGGALDMTGEADLTGLSVLVLEDDFYLAGDTERALSRAGATVVGPYGNESAALKRIIENGLDCAVVDINLGRGPSFEVAKALTAKRIPFIFVTGYDDAIISAEFESVKKLQKPIELRQIVRAVAQLTHAA